MTKEKTKVEEIKTKFTDVDYSLVDNPDGTRTIKYGNGANITFRCLTFKEYTELKVQSPELAEFKTKQLELSITEGKEYLDQLGWHEGEALWYELVDFKLRLDFHTKTAN